MSHLGGRRFKAWSQALAGLSLQREINQIDKSSVRTHD
jgi:hypothetical protein